MNTRRCEKCQYGEDHIHWPAVLTWLFVIGVGAASAWLIINVALNVWQAR